MIFTFYSYKGGVGRSMALANIAVLFYQQGFNVLMVDWDLEAPGLEKFFFSENPQRLEEIGAEDGIIDMLLAYKQQVQKDWKFLEDEELPFKRPAELAQPIDIQPNPNNGKLSLLTAGRRSYDNFSKYANSVLTFDWLDFYHNWHGELYFEWLRRQFETMAEIVLIDSRTGVTEMGGVCTYQLADVIVMFCAPNTQNLDGTVRMAKNFISKEVKDIRPKERPLDLLVIPARIEDVESELLDFFKEEFVEKFSPLMASIGKITPEQLWELRIPYIPKYAYSERVAVQEGRKASAEEIVKAFKRLGQLMQELRDAQLSRAHLLRKKLTEFEMKYRALSEKMSLMSTDLLTETDISLKFRLEKQIKQTVEELKELEKGIEMQIQSQEYLPQKPLQQGKFSELLCQYGLISNEIKQRRINVVLETDSYTRLIIQNEIGRAEEQRNHLISQITILKDAPKDFSLQHLRQKFRELEIQYDLLSEKIGRLYNALPIQADVIEEFKIKRQIEQTELQRENIVSQMIQSEVCPTDFLREHLNLKLRELGNLNKRWNEARELYLSTIHKLKPDVLIVNEKRRYEIMATEVQIEIDKINQKEKEVEEQLNQLSLGSSHFSKN